MLLSFDVTNLPGPVYWDNSCNFSVTSHKEIIKLVDARLKQLKHGLDM